MQKSEVNLKSPLYFLINIRIDHQCILRISFWCLSQLEMVADLSLAQRQFRNTLQPPLGGPWLQPKAQGALIAFLLLSHLSKPNPLLSPDLQMGSPPQNPGHQTNTDQHLHLLPSGSSPGSCQHRNPSPTLSTMRLHLTHSAPTDLKRQGLESTGTQTTSSTSL